MPLIIVLIILSSCKTIKVKNDIFTVSSDEVELGSMGRSKSYDFQSEFNVRSIPKLDNKIRLHVEVIPFTKKLHKIYTNKYKFDQNLPKVSFIDSIPEKPEIVLLRIMDVVGLIGELNSNYNSDILTLMRDTENIEMISSIVVSLPKLEIEKIKQSDAVYLVNKDDRKLTLALYKDGKPTSSVNINGGKNIGYRISKFCWASTDRGKWYIADITENATCHGNSSESIGKKAKLKSLSKF